LRLGQGSGYCIAPLRVAHCTQCLEVLDTICHHRRHRSKSILHSLLAHGDGPFDGDLGFLNGGVTRSFQSCTDIPVSTNVLSVEFTAHLHKNIAITVATIHHPCHIFELPQPSNYLQVTRQLHTTFKTLHPHSPSRYLHVSGPINHPPASTHGSRSVISTAVLRSTQRKHFVHKSRRGSTRSIYTCDKRNLR
jgi:hypothetical protein